MEILLRIVTRRNVLMAASVTGIVALGLRYQEHPRRWFRDRFYPPQGAAPAAGRDLMQNQEARESRRIMKRYERVMEILALSKQEGFQTAGLEAKATAALKLNAPGYREFAVSTLSEVEMAAPRKKVQYIPMYPREDDQDIEIPPDLPGQQAGVPAKPALKPKSSSKTKPRKAGR